MLRQYNAQRRRGGHNPHGVGTIDIGSIVYIQDNLRPLGGFRGRIVRREPWIIESWVNREYCTATPALPDGQAAAPPRITYMLGGHLAIVRSLRTGRRKVVADWILLMCDELGLMVWAMPLPIPALRPFVPAPPKRKRRRKAA